MRATTAQSIVDYYRGSGSVYEVFATLPQPTIAAITGYFVMPAARRFTMRIVNLIDGTV